MHLILLPGNSKSNKEWIENVAKNFSDIFESTNILYYSHWDEENKNIDFNKELDSLKNIVNEINDTNYVIFGKSAGSILALKAIDAEIILPMACIFTGFAYSFAKESGQEIDKWLKGYNIPTLFIQKEEDPAIHAKDLEELLKSKNMENITLEKIAGNDHHYGDLDLLHNLVSDFFADNED